MSKNPDVYLLYEYSDKISFTVRMKVCLDCTVDPEMLREASQEAISRFPYFRVQIGLDEKQNILLEPNDRPIAVLPEKDERLILGSDSVNRHLLAITYRDDCVWFNFSHSLCGAFGALFWVKATLYQYMIKKYGLLKAPMDIKLPGTKVAEEELFYPDADKLPKDEPISRYTGGDTNIAIGRMLKFLLNPFARDNYYYQVDIPAKEFMDYAARIDGSPNTILAAILYKVCALYFRENAKNHISGRIAADYRSDVGADFSYRDFVRLIHIKYEWSWKEESIQKLNMRARGQVIAQNQAELSCERFFRMEKVHDEIDRQPDLKSKKKYASSHSTFRSDPRDIYTISYVGKTDWGEMDSHIKGVYTLTDGDFMLEVNALGDRFCIAFQLINKDRKPVDLFCRILDQEKIPYKVSERLKRNLPRIEMP